LRSIKQRSKSKKVRTITNSKDISPVKQNELLSLTGYIRGGCSPLGMKRKYPTFFDESAILFDAISISAGQRGLQIFANAEKLAEAIDAEFTSLTL
jgi:Cys-tRNA(Pro)/Cys-tRNA(Cys) deacylase